MNLKSPETRQNWSRRYHESQFRENWSDRGLRAFLARTSDHSCMFSGFWVLLTHSFPIDARCSIRSDAAASASVWSCIGKLHRHSAGALEWAVALPREIHASLVRNCRLFKFYWISFPAVLSATIFVSTNIKNRAASTFMLVLDNCLKACKMKHSNVVSKTVISRNLWKCSIWISKVVRKFPPLFIHAEFGRLSEPRSLI